MSEPITRIVACGTGTLEVYSHKVSCDEEFEVISRTAGELRLRLGARVQSGAMPCPTVIRVGTNYGAIGAGQCIQLGGPTTVSLDGVRVEKGGPATVSLDGVSIEKRDDDLYISGAKRVKRIFIDGVHVPHVSVAACPAPDIERPMRLTEYTGTFEIRSITLTSEVTCYITQKSLTTTKLTVDLSGYARLVVVGCTGIESLEKLHASVFGHGVLDLSNHGLFVVNDEVEIHITGVSRAMVTTGRSAIRTIYKSGLGVVQFIEARVD